MNRLLIIAASLFVTLILGVVLISPKYQDFALIRSQVEEREAELASREEYFASLGGVSEKLNQYQKQLAIIDSALPPEPSLPNLFNYFQKAASQNGLVLTGMTPAGTASANGLRETRVILVMSGSYSSFKSLLSTLENSARIIEPESISFTSPEEEVFFTFNLRIKTHSY